MVGCRLHLSERVKPRSGAAVEVDEVQKLRRKEEREEKKTEEQEESESGFVRRGVDDYGGAFGGVHGRIRNRRQNNRRQVVLDGVQTTIG